jgi:hypothetical protein
MEQRALPLEFFKRTSDDIGTLLRLIEERRTGEQPHAQWVVDTDHLAVFASANGLSSEELQEIVTDAYEGFKVLEEQGDIWPPSITEEAQAITRRVVNRVRRMAPARIEVIGHEPLLIKPQDPQTRPRRIHERYAAWSSIDGRLDVISVRRQPYFVIYEHGTNQRIRCSFPDDWLGLVKDYLGYRVTAEGFIHYRTDGAPVSLSSPTSLERVPEPEQIDITSYRGTMPGITGGLSSYEYVRQMRDLEDG